MWKRRMEKISFRKHQFLQKYYFAISKIKLPQKFRTERYLSKTFITLYYYSTRFHHLRQATGAVLDIAAGSIKNIFLICHRFWLGVRSNGRRPNFLTCVLRQRKSIAFFVNAESVRCSFWTLSLALYLSIGLSSPV